MKAIRILAVLALIFFVVDVLGDAVTGFIRGMEMSQEQMEKGETHLSETCSLELKPAGGKPLLEIKSGNGGQGTMPCEIETVNVKNINPSVGYWIIMVVMAPLAFVSLFSLYCVARMIISVLNGSVFIKRNVWRMRIFVYSLLLIGLLMELQRWIIYNSVSPQVNIEGYEVAGYSFICPWFSYIMLALFTEIFAVGVKLKEEQDLTI